MIDINLDNTYSFSCDDRQYILYKRYGDKRKPIAFFCELNNLFERYIRICLTKSNAKTIQELLDYHKEVIRSLNITLNPLKIKVVSLSEGDNTKC